jgi:phage-related protein (TIGR01555 family)
MAKTPKKPANVTPIRSTVRGSGRSDSAAILDHNPGRLDGWINVLTGLGNAARDKRMGAQVQAERIDYETCLEFYRSNDLAARLVDIIPDEMTREGWDVKIEGDTDAQEAVEAWTEENGIVEIVNEGLRMAEWAGGGGTILGIDDGQDPAKPLNVDRVDSLSWFNNLTSRELPALRYYVDPMAPKLGLPAIYRVQPQVVGAVDPDEVDGVSAKNAAIRSNVKAGLWPPVHESRILIWQGTVATKRQLREGQGWGDSAFNRISRVLRDFDMSWDAAAILVSDFSQAVLKIKGLTEALAGDQDQAVVARATLIDLCRSVARMILLDSEEDFERKATPLTGLPELLEKFMLRLAASRGVPVSMLMGQAPAGLNATGDSDIRWFYDSIAARQRRKLLPNLKRLYTLAFMAKDGPTGGVVPENWSIKFRRLWQLDDLQESTRRLNNAQADAAMVNAGILQPEEVAESRFGGDAYGEEIDLDQELRAEVEQMQQAQQEAQLEAMANGTAPAPGAPPGAAANGDPAQPQVQTSGPKKPAAKPKG